MKKHEAPILYSELNLAEAHALTAANANYVEKPDPQGILRKGLVEEVAEYAWEVAQGHAVDKDQIEGEIGDVLWYVSEISRFHDTTVDGLSAGQSFDAFQAQANLSNVLPIIGADNTTIDIEEQPHIALAVAALRVVDVLNPKNDDLWLPDRQRAPLEKALSDLVTTSSFIASKHSILLSDSLNHTVKKLSARERSPHVIEEAKKNELMSSMRQRLMIHPFVGKLLVKTLSAEISPKA